MKLLLSLLCASSLSLNAAVIIQESNNGITTTISTLGNSGQYSYRYDIDMSPNDIDWEDLGLIPTYREFSLWYANEEGETVTVYSEGIPIEGRFSGKFTVKFHSDDAPMLGHIQNQLNFVGGRSGMLMEGWIPSSSDCVSTSVPEPAAIILGAFGTLMLLQRRK